MNSNLSKTGKHLQSLAVILSFGVFVFSVIGSLSFSMAGEGNTAALVTYGPEAYTIEGDNDYLQVIFLSVPEDGSKKTALYLFDADCGGTWDARYSGSWDTVTRFRLYGGDGAFSAEGLKRPTPAKNALYSGNLIAEVEYGYDPAIDNNRVLFAEFDRDQGESIDGKRYFKLVVEGMSGNDGNRFFVYPEKGTDTGKAVSGISMFTYSPTINLPSKDVFVEIHFRAPSDVRDIIVHNFDMAGATLGVNTSFREKIHVRSSGQNRWVKSRVRLKKEEAGRICAIRFEGGEEIPNDGTFYVTDEKKRILPIFLPARLLKKKRNLRANVKAYFEVQEDCREFLFDASGTVDPEGDPLRFNWDFGDGGNAEGERVTHRYDEPGEYKVSLVVSDLSGRVFNSVKRILYVKVNRSPAAVAGDDLTVAPKRKVTFNASKSTDSDGKILRYSWDYGDGSKSSGAWTHHSYSEPGKYTAVLRVEDDSGTPCNFAFDERIITVNAAPIAVIEGPAIASIGQPVIFNGENSHDTDGRIVKWEWRLGDGTSGTEPVIIHAFARPGTYRVLLRVTDDSSTANRTSEQTAGIVINDPPKAAAGKDKKAAVGEPVVFDGSLSRDRDGNLVEYFWDFGDGTKWSEPCVPGAKKCGKTTHTFTKSGIYEAILTVRDDSGSSTDTDSDRVSVFVNDPPTAHAGTDMVVTRSLVKFDGSGSVDSDGRIIRYKWDFGDGTGAEGVSPAHVYRNPGVYKVTLRVTDDSNTSSRTASSTIIVTVNGKPVADAGPDRGGAPGEEIIFDGTASIDPDGEIREYHWNFGDGNEASGSKVSHSFEKPGIYNVLLTVRDDTGHEEAEAFDTAVVRINQPPIAVAGRDLRISSGQTVILDGTASRDPDGKISSYRWKFSDDWAPSEKILTSPTLKRTFKTPGTYNVILTVADDSGASNGTARDTLLVRVNHSPSADAGNNIFSTSKTISFDGSASFDPDGEKLYFFWDFGDGAKPAREINPIHTFQKGGTYPVVLTVDDGTGLKNARSSASISVKINEPPVADAGNDIDACAGKNVLFDGSRSYDPEGGPLKYHWDFGDGATSNVVNPAKVFPRGGIYPVILTVTDDSGLDEENTSVDRILVKVGESPVADAGQDQEVCAGSPVTFDGSGSRDIDGVVNSFFWDFGDGTTGGGPNPVHVYEKAGAYRVTLVITGDLIGECDNTDSDEMIVTVHQAPSIEIKTLDRVMEGNLFRLDGVRKNEASEDNLSWEWNFGDGSAASGKSVEHMYKTSGEYLVSLTAASGSGEPCSKTTVQRKIRVNAAPSVDFTMSVPGRKKKDSAPEKPLIAGTGETITFDGSLSKDTDGQIASHVWNFGDGKTDEGVFVRHAYKKSGKYRVSLTVTDDSDLDGGRVSVSKTCVVNAAPRPAIRFGEAGDESRSVFCTGDPVKMSAGDSSDPDGTIQFFSWNFGDQTPEENGSDVSHTYRNPGEYIVTLFVDDGRGASNSMVSITRSLVINEPPVADAGIHSTTHIVSKNRAVLFNGSESFDPEGKRIEYFWDFGDGTDGKGPKPTHVYKKPGMYEVRLTVTDGSMTACGTASDSFSLRVNTPPVARAGGDRTAFCGGANDDVVFDARKSHDPDKDPLTYHWDFGDGEKGSGPVVMHRYRKPGTFKVRLRVDDGTGLKSGTAFDDATIIVKKH